MSGRRLKVWFDGGARPNPGRIELAVVARGVVHIVEDAGQGSNEDAEWLALIHALRLAQGLGAAEFDLIGDCAPVIAQASGAARCRSPRSQQHLAAFTALAAAGAPTRIRWTRRAQNLAGIALARRHPR